VFIPLAPRRGQGVDHTHQPPGGYSNLSGIAGVGQGSPEGDNVQSKRAAQQAYQEELKKQVSLPNIYLMYTMIGVVNRMQYTLL
jgi:hypothetical protein